jgi:membrane protein DedA with SNARE-associated domain
VKNRQRIPFYRRRKFFFIAGILLVMGIFSLTIGRDLYLGRPSNILSFAVIHFAGYLFFLLMPVEAAYIYFMAQHGNTFILTFLALSTAMAALIVDYYCGLLVSRQFIEKFIKKERYEKSKSYILKYGNVTIFIFNLLPLSSPLLILAAGMIKYPLKPVIIYSLLGLFFKYFIMMLFFV